MWIDAICIDQSNIPERNEQVSKMADIYRNADQVLVWIGEESDDSQLALEFFQRLNKTVRAGSRHHLSPKEVTSACSFSQRTYWKRAWIIQEIVYARETIIYCGPMFINWQEIVCFLKTFMDQVMDPKDRSKIASNVQPINIIYYMSDPELRGEMLQEPEKVLQEFGKHEASDPRDHIFAAVGLLRELQTPGFVDYSKTYEDVCIETAVLLLVQTRRLDFICHCQHRIHDKNVHHLPSWVPDWTTPLLYKDLRAPLCRPLPLERQITAEAEISMRVLVSKGVLLGSVQRIGRPGSIMNGLAGTAESFYDWQNILASVMPSECMFQDSFVRLFVNPVSAEDKKFWREQLIGIILAVDNVMRPQKSLPKHLMKYRDFNCESDSISYALMVRIMACMRERRLVVTNNGNFGLAPNATQVGDIVCHLLGCLSPIILRPNGDSGYIHMGYTDIANFMEGEAMVGLAEGKYELQEFEIH